MIDFRDTTPHINWACIPIFYLFFGVKGRL
uniref:Uncharacterized protein n=1 Tax=Siphoviridae sp. ctL0q1 TaxID=2825449 RepID=A0A8S5PKD7_9CAUD|nr:MAG TPA: hypothetical protein [Siphoviridae sp. ctL0q1]